MDPIQLVHTPGPLFTWLSLMCYEHFLASRPSCETPNFKQHVAGIEVSGLFDLKKDHAVFAFGVS